LDGLLLNTTIDSKSNLHLVDITEHKYCSWNVTLHTPAMVEEFGCDVLESLVVRPQLTVAKPVKVLVWVASSG